MDKPAIIEEVWPYTGIKATWLVEEVDGEIVMRYLGPLIGLKQDEQQATPEDPEVITQ